MTLLCQLSDPVPADASAESAPRCAGNTPYRLLDAWRGVAALWVVLLHVRLPDTPAPLYEFSLLGLLGVPMFFVISGYCIAHAALRSLDRPQPVVRFLGARVRRIYPPYFLASLLAALLSLLLTVLVQHHVVPSSQIAELNLRHQGWQFYVGALTLTQVPMHTALLVRVFWSLSYEAAFYVIVAAFLWGALRTKQTPHLLDGLGWLTVGVLVWLNVAGGACPFPWNLWPQFGLGVLVYQILAQPGRKTPRIVFLLCGILLVLYAGRHGGEGSAEGVSDGMRAIFSLGFAAVLLVLFRWDDRLAGLWPARVFSRVGLFSYSLYLIHLLALGIVTQGLNRLHVLDSHPVLLFWAKFALCLAVGRLFFRVCEHPFLDSRQRQVQHESLAPV